MIVLGNWKALTFTITIVILNIYFTCSFYFPSKNVGNRLIDNDIADILEK